MEKNKLMKKVIEIFKKFFNNRVLFCDLDGTLIVTKSGKTFPEDENDWKFKPGICYAIRQYNPKYIFIISNQGGIEKGFVDEKKFIAKMKVIVSEIRTWGNYIVDYNYCKSNDPTHPYRKPNDGMIHDFKHNYADGYDFSNKDALMIGDASGKEGQFSDSDIQCAKNAGIRYCDVDDFIEASNPCNTCTITSLCGDSAYEPFLPCYLSYRERLKMVIENHKN